LTQHIQDSKKDNNCSKAKNDDKEEKVVNAKHQDINKK
jgi:hypothetical protein